MADIKPSPAVPDASTRKGHNNPPSEAGDRVRQMRARDRERGVVSHTVRAPLAYKTALTVLAKIFRDGTPAEQRRALVTIANLEQRVLGGIESSALAKGLTDPVQEAFARSAPDRRCRQSEALFNELVDRMIKNGS